MDELLSLLIIGVVGIGGVMLIAIAIQKIIDALTE